MKSFGYYHVWIEFCCYNEITHKLLKSTIRYTEDLNRVSTEGTWIHRVINIQHRPHQLQAHCKLVTIIARHYGILVIHYKNFNGFTNSICLCVCEHIGYETITSTIDHQFTPYFACCWGMWLVRWLLFLRQAEVDIIF